MPYGRKVWVDECVLEELKDVLGLGSDAEAVREAAMRVVELEEIVDWLAEMDRLQLPVEWEQDPDAWSGGE